MRVVHRTSGRVRLEAPQLRGQLDEARRLAEAAGAVPGVSKAEARTATGSLVIFHTGEWAPLAAALGEAFGVAIEEPEPQALAGPDALSAAAAVVDALDQGARRALGGRANLSELTFLALVAAGAVQLARGQVVGPASALFGQALTLMAARRSRSAG